MPAPDPEPPKPPEFFERHIHRIQDLLGALKNHWAPTRSLPFRRLDLLRARSQRPCASS